jgi:REP element-mobilizing transposase RayT
VRRAFLLGEGMHNRKSWIDHRLEELAEIFSVAVAGFAILDNHLHLLVRLDPDVAQGWSDEDVVRRWGRLFPPRDKARQVAPVSEKWVQARLKDARWVATARERLQSLSWFMKCLKEPLSRLANREEQTRGAFFEGRFKSVAILDEESLLATCAYIDLNPVAAGIAEVPEASTYLDQATGRACQGAGASQRPERRPSRQRPGLDCGGGPGGGAVALSGRGSTAAGFVTRRDARRILAGQLRASGGVHRAVVPRGQSRDLR